MRKFLFPKMPIKSYAVVGVLLMISLLVGAIPVSADSNPNDKNQLLAFSKKRMVKLSSNNFKPNFLTEDSGLAIVQQINLVAEDPGALDEFGWSVAIDANTAVVGARNEDPDLGKGPIENAGAVYVYARSGNSWYQEAKLVAKDATRSDTFGVAVAISGNTIVVGAPGVDGENADGDELEDVGAAYVFVREGIHWRQLAKLEPSDGTEGDAFGTAVTIDGWTIAVGADSKAFEFFIPPDEKISLPDGGAAYVFVRSAKSNWKEQAKILPGDPELGDNFGTAVDVSGDTLVVGATELNIYENKGSGEAYVFTRSGKTWTQQAKIRPKDAANGDGFGTSVAIDDDRLIVGAVFKDPILGKRRITNAGAAYIFKRLGDKWIQESVLVPENASSFDYFGRSVDIFRNTAVVGADGTNYAGFSSVGAAYIFARVSKVWQQQTFTTADYVFNYDSFGRSIAISGDKVIIGANGRDPRQLSKAGEAFLANLGTAQLPDTGFAPDVVTSLPKQPLSKAYASYGDLWLEIPRLGVRTSIVGVPESGNGWDVDWLWNKAGYLQGTAFPTWSGNTGIAGHAVLPSGQPGPFAEFSNLRYGDKVIIHAYGDKYIYEVQDNSLKKPSNMNVLGHEDKDWVTLITCQDFDAKNNSYQWRRVVKAILVSFGP